MTKGQVTIGVVTVGTVLVGFLVAWNSWGSIEIISQGKQTAAIIEWQKHATEDLKVYQQKSDEKFASLSEDVTQMKIDAATTKELVKIIGTRYQINSEAVEARVIREVKKDERASSTISKTL